MNLENNSMYFHGYCAYRVGKVMIPLTVAGKLKKVYKGLHFQRNVNLGEMLKSGQK